MNPVAPTKMKKALQRISNLSQINLPEETLKYLMEEYQGDIRAATNAFQMWSLSRKHFSSNNSSSTNSTFLFKDSPLTLFHALGRFLYDKSTTVFIVLF